MKVCITLAIIFVSTFIIHKLAYQSSEWKYYEEYNAYRTEVYDYYMYPKYEENMEFYDSIGIEKEEMYLVQSMNLDLSSEITSETMNAIYDRSKEIKKEYLQFTNIPRKITYDYLDSFEKVNREEIFLYLLYGIILLYSVVKKKNSYIIGFVLTFIARTGMRCYLIYMNRFPPRVSSPLTLIEVVTLIGILFVIINDEKKKEIIEEQTKEQEKIGYYIGIIFVILFMFILLGDVYKENKDRNIEMKVEEVWSENVFSHIVEDQDHTYLLDVYSISRMKGPVFGENKFPSNAIILGGWLQESPLIEQQYINRYETDFDIEYLLRRDTYFVQSEGILTSWIVDYFRSVDYEVQVEVANQISQNGNVLFNVYSVK